jgi:hypothetical protein
MKIKRVLLLSGIFICVLTTTTALGSLIGIATISWPRTESDWDYWNFSGNLPPGKVSHISVDWDDRVYAEMADGIKYVLEKGEWTETSRVAQGPSPAKYCPRLRPAAKVVAEVCYPFYTGDIIIVVLEDGSVWTHQIYGDDNYRTFKAVYAGLAIFTASGSGFLLGIVIFIIIWVWLRSRPSISP